MEAAVQGDWRGARQSQRGFRAEGRRRTTAVMGAEAAACACMCMCMCTCKCVRLLGYEVEEGRRHSSSVARRRGPGVLDLFWGAGTERVGQGAT